MKNKIPSRAWILPLLFISAQISSCDILRLSPFEVSKWGPGSGRYDEPGAISIFMEFSHEPDKAGIEKNFSMLEDGYKVKGLFQWEGKKMIFLPLSPLEKNRDYTVELPADASDTNGLSLDRAFEGRFSTRPDDTRPRLIDFFPEMDAVVDDQRQPVSLTFSQEIPLSSLHDYVSFSPSMGGAWDSHGGEAVFYPFEPWDFGKRYEMRIQASLRGNNGKTLGREYASVFSIGTDTEKPLLVGAWRITEYGDEVKLIEDNINEFFENSGWERNDSIRFDFSKKVDTLSVKNCLNAVGASMLLMETAPGFSEEVVFSFETAPTYKSRFSMTLKNGVKDIYGNESAGQHAFKIYADGINSKPPALIGMRIPMAPGNSSDQQAAAYGTDSLFADLPIMDGSDKYPYTVETETWIELYFDTAPDTQINIFSLMELFHVNTSNNVITFSPRNVKTADFSSPAPHSGWEAYCRVEVQGGLTNSINSGIVYFEISSGLTDCNGNRNTDTMRISLLK